MTKSLLAVLAFFMVLVGMKPAVAGQIVDREWVFNLLTVTYSPTQSRVECTAFNSSGTAIGGGSGYPVGGVARVIIQVPMKYEGKNLRVSCKEKSLF